MSRLIVRGPAELSGDVSVRGAKNAALPILIATAAGIEPVIRSLDFLSENMVMQESHSLVDVTLVTVSSIFIWMA